MSARTAPQKFLKHATDVALFYGFRPAHEIERLAQSTKGDLKGRSKPHGVYSFSTSASVAAAFAASRPHEPALIFYATPSPGYLAPPTVEGLSARDLGEFGLQVIGSQESVGEVVLLKTVSAIIEEWGGSLTRVRLNTLGDKDSQSRFVRELSFYARKQLQNLDEACRQNVASNPFALYRCSHAACLTVLAEGPRPMNFLSEKSRAHFRMVLEHLENLGLPYEIDDLLAGDERDPQLAFAFDFEASDGTLVSATGGRFDDFFKRQTARRESAGVAASIFFRKKGADRATFASRAPARAPKVYFVQLGTRAKLQGLAVVDILRAARIPVSQSFDATHLSPQLNAAKELGVSYMLIMGQREALDGTVIVRSTNNSSQTTVAIPQLPRFLKTLRS